MSVLEKTIKVEKDSDNEGEFSLTAADSGSSDLKEVHTQSLEKTSARSSVGSTCDQISAGESELRTMLEENALQALTEESVLKRPRLVYYEEVGDADLMSLTFPKKLWKIVESDQFASIRWDDGGNCVVIDEESFKKEVLERRGPSRIFETDCMKSFIRQLNLYGFSKIRQDFQRSASLSEFIAEEKGAVSMTKFQFYHNLNFRRDYPHLLPRMKRRVGIKSAIPSLNCAEGDSSCDFPVSGGTQGAPRQLIQTLSVPQNNLMPPSRENEQKYVFENNLSNQRVSNSGNTNGNSNAAPPALAVRPSDHIATEQSAKVNQMTQFHPSQHGGLMRAGNHGVETSSTTSATSVYHLMPPMAAGFGPMMGMPGFQGMYPDLATAAAQAHLASLLPFCNPWFSMPMMAAASAISMSSGSSVHHHRPPHHHHCPNCNCQGGNGPSTRSGPRNSDYITGPHR
ncbi:heat shock transcription factor, Y-linked-like [Callorhinchus milii]|uniref:heat shock transcription factor, Y-linked-like n=1 Tax=Callorhinchus milii TaxID=7868 RepID=UPI001C3FC3BC|nr:heat shock transcription factor, Y-linked-like [Callorhinchus milii]